MSVSRRRVKNLRRGQWILVGVTVASAAIGLPMMAIAGVGATSFAFVNGSLIAGAGAGAEWGWARRAKRALHFAQQARELPPRPMQMRLVWTVGHGHGPLAVVYLWYLERDLRTPPAFEVPVVDVPVGFDPSDGLRVEVRMDEHRAALIHAGDVELWPEDLARSRKSG